MRASHTFNLGRVDASPLRPQALNLFSPDIRLISGQPVAYWLRHLSGTQKVGGSRWCSHNKISAAVGP